MRLNQFLAQHTVLSRRKADEAISAGRVEINGVLARLGDVVIESDKISLDGQIIETQVKILTLMLHKPVGYVVSRNGQGSQTIYDLLPAKYHHLKPVGRLDKDSSGLLLLTSDGQLANQLSHPRYQKTKRYRVELDRRLHAADRSKIIGRGVNIGDERPSQFKVLPVSDTTLDVHLQEGRNRQIRRTFEALGYKVIGLHRTHFGEYSLQSLKSGEFSVIV